MGGRVPLFILSIFWVWVGFGCDAGVWLCRFVAPIDRGMVQYACAGVCLARGGGVVVEPRASYHAFVRQSLLEGRRENPPQLCVL